MNARKAMQGGLVVLRQEFLDQQKQMPKTKYFVFPVEDVSMNERQLHKFMATVFGIEKKQVELALEAWDKDIHANEAHFGQNGHFLFVK